MAIGLAATLVSGGAMAATIDWKGHTWQVTSGAMAGVCQGNPANVTVDANGYLHFRISNAGGTWTASEMFTTDKLGFGTYQWQVDGPIDAYDKNVVLGLFPYGPAAGIGSDSTNEIDIEYSRWGVANGPNGDWTDYPASGTTIGEMSYTFSLAGSTLSTSRFAWTTTSITSALLGGLQPVGGNDSLIRSWTYMPSNPTVNIPQQPLPLGMNLWCFDTPPSNGQPVEIVIRDFTFVPEGTTGTGGAGGGGGRGGSGGRGGAGGGGAGGSGGAGGGGGRGGAGGSGGRGGAGGGGAGGSGGRGGAGGSTGAGGTAGVGGAGGQGTAGTSGASGAGGTGGIAGAGAAGGTGTAGTSSGGRGGGGGTANVAGGGSGCGCSVHDTDDAGIAGIALMLALAAVTRRRPRPSSS
jgi:hypothetical protein